MATIRWGMIGCGDVTEIKSGPGFRKATDSTLVAVSRRNGALAEDYARRHGVPRWHTDPDEIVNAPDIDAVYIATWPDSHPEYALRCAAAGKPTLVEKPMAGTPDECARMNEAFTQAGVPLWVAFYRRALPRLIKVRELLDDGAVGPVRAVRSTLVAPLAPPGKVPPAADPALSRGLFADQLCHTLDLYDWFFGPVEHAHGLAANTTGRYATPDTVTATFRLGSGVLGSGVWCHAGQTPYEVNEVIGAAGRLLFATFTDSPIQLVRPGGTETVHVADPPHVHQPLIQTIVDELNGAGSCPSTGITAARTAWVCDQILADW